MEEQQQASRKKLIGSYICSLVFCVFPLHITGLAIAAAHKDTAAEVCGADLPLATWVFIYCGIGLGAAVLQFPSIFNNIYSKTWSFFIMIASCSASVALLIWGASFFWGSDMTDDCKHGVAPLYKMMYALLVLGYIGLAFVAWTLVTTFLALIVLWKTKQ